MMKHFNSITVEEAKERYEVFLMNDLNDQYIAIFSERSEKQDPLTTSATQAFQVKIKKALSRENINLKG